MPILLPSPRRRRDRLPPPPRRRPRALPRPHPPRPCLLPLLPPRPRQRRPRRRLSPHRLTDSDDPSNLAGVQSLTDALVDAYALNLLDHSLSRFSEANPDKADAVHHTLAVLQSLFDLRSHLSDLVCDHTKLLRWLLANLKARDFDGRRFSHNWLRAVSDRSSIQTVFSTKQRTVGVLPSLVYPNDHSSRTRSSQSH